MHAHPPPTPLHLLARPCVPSCLAAGVRSSHQSHFCELARVVLKATEEERYLRVILFNHLSWGPHIRKIETRANQRLWFIKNNLRGCLQDLKRLLVHHPSARWSSVFHCSVGPTPRQDIEQLERPSDKELTRYLQTTTPGPVVLNLNSLHERTREWLVFLYKILNDHVVMPVSKIDLVLN